MRPLCANACFNIFLIYHLFSQYEFHATYVEVRKNFWDSILFFQLVALRVEWRLSGLVASTPTC